MNGVLLTPARHDLKASHKKDPSTLYSVVFCAGVDWVRCVVPL